MSIEAIIWVRKHAPVKNATEMCILYSLADRANDDGTGCWPSNETIADEARCSERTVQRHMKELASRRLIVPGDGRMVASYRSDRRPNVWDLNMSLRRDDTGCQNDTPSKSEVSSDAERGDNGGNHGVTSSAERGDTVVTQTILNPPMEPPLNQPPITPQGGDDHSSADRFDDFWEVVPKKVGKQAARRAWKKAVKSTAPDVVIEGMKRYRDDPNRSDAFTKNPQGWLNDGRWMDDPLPAREERQTRQNALRRSNTMEAWLGISEGTLDRQATFGGFEALRGDIIDGQVINQRELGR